MVVSFFNIFPGHDTILGRLPVPSLTWACWQGAMKSRRLPAPLLTLPPGGGLFQNIIGYSDGRRPQDYHQDRREDEENQGEDQLDRGLGHQFL